MKKTILSLLVAFLAINSFAQIQIGFGTSVNQNLPIEPFYGYTYSQSIYYSNEIQTSDTIEGIKYYFNGTSLSSSDSVTVYMGLTTKTSFTSVTDWAPLTSLKQVFKGKLSNTSGPGWKTIILDTGFVYNKAFNLIIAVEEDRPNYNSSSDDFYCSLTPSQRSIVFYDDTQNPIAATPPSATALSNYIPNIILDSISHLTNISSFLPGTDTLNITWTPGLNDSAWLIQYGTVGFTLGTGIILPSNNDTATIYGLTPFTEYDVYVLGIVFSGDSSDWIGPLKAKTLSTCPTPSVNVYEVSDTSLSMVILPAPAGSNDSVYFVEIGPLGFLLGTGTVYNTTNDTLIINGLNSNTPYDIYVSTVCTVGDTSLVSGPVSATTECGIIVAAWLENVETHVPTTSSSIVNCWSSVPADSTNKYRWDITGNGTTPTGTTGPASAHSGVKYFYTEATSGALNDSAILLSPIVDLTQLSSPSLSFYYHMYGAGMGNLFVDVFDGTTWQYGVRSILGQQQTTAGQSWKKIVIDLSPYGDTVQIRFRAKRGTNGNGDISIDDIAFEEGPGCFDPYAFLNYDIDDDSASFTWTGNVSDSTYEIQYGPSGFGIGTGTSLFFNNDTAIISGLEPAKAYQFYVRSICPGGATGNWVGPVLVTTACPDSGFVPSYIQPFTLYLPQCWVEASGRLTDSSTLTYGTSTWIADGFGNIGTTGSAKINIYGTTAKEWLISPSINLGNGSINYQVEFDIALTAFNNTNPDTLQADDTLAFVISTDDGITWSDTNIIFTWKDGVEPSNTGDHAKFLLSGYTNTVKFGFYGASTITGEDVDVFIDNFWVREVPTCIEPDSLYSVFVGEDSAVISWNNGPTDSMWMVEYGVEGFIQGTGILDTLSIDTAYLASLLPNRKYDIYLRSICIGLDTSIWIGPFNFKTTCPVAFVAPYMDSVEGHAITTNASIANCWYALPTSTTTSYRWDITGTGTTPSNGLTGPNFANSGTKYFYTEASSGNLGDTATLFSPMVDISTLTIPSLSFSYHMFGAMMGQLHVDIFDGTNWVLDVWNISGQQNTSGSTPWKKVILDLAAYSDTIQVRFRAVRGSDYTGDISIDDVKFEEGPSCFNPSSLTAYYVNYDSVGLTWNTFSTDSMYIVEYDTAGFTLGTGNQVTTTNDTLGIGSLLDNTNYSFYVRNICSLGDSSAWFGPITIKTPCAPFVSPWIDSVETHTPTLNSTIANCWTSSPSNTTSLYRWDISNSGTTPSTQTGPNSAYSGVKFFYTEASSGVLGDSALLTSPVVDLSTLTAPSLSFYYHMHGSTMGNLFVDVFDGTNWNRGVWSKVGQQQTAQSDPWKYAIIDLSTYGNNVRVRFRATRGSNFYSDISIDNISFDNGPSCFPVTSLTSYFIDADSVGLTWNTNSTDSLYLIEYDTVGFTLGTGNTVVTTNDSIVLNGLLGNTKYDFYIRNVCHLGDSSLWLGPISIKTICDAVLTAPLTENVELQPIVTNSVIENCWKTTPTNTTLSYRWNVTNTTTPTTSTGPNAAYNGTKFFYTESSEGISGDSAVLLSPTVDVTTLNIPSLSFYYHMYGSSMGQLHVDVYDGTTWNRGVWSKVGQQQISGAAPWQNAIVDLRPYGDTVQVRFRAIRGTSIYGDISIDNIVFDEGPACFDPISIKTYYASYDSIGVTYTGNFADSTYLIEYGPKGFTPGTGTTITSTNDSIMMTGLNADTEYDFYVRSICLGGDTSDYVGPAVDTTLPLCVRIQSFTVITADSTSMDIGWNTDPTHNGFIVEYGLTGFTQGSGTVVTTSVNFLQITGLSPQTTYDFYIRSVCMSGDSSVWDGPYQGTTGCSYLSLTWTEGFENLIAYGTNEIPLCWEQDAYWITDTVTLSYNRQSRTGKGYLYTSYGSDDWVFSPYFKLDTSGVYEFSFWYNTDGYSGWDTVRLAVGNSQARTAMTTTLFEANEPMHTTYQQVKAYFKPTIAGLYSFGVFVNGNFTPWYISFDDFNLMDTVNHIGINELLSNNNFAIYPNPNTGSFNIVNKGNSTKTSISIMDIQGREVFAKQAYFTNGGQEKIDIQQVEKGVYTIVLSYNGIKEQYRVIIE